MGSTMSSSTTSGSHTCLQATLRGAVEEATATSAPKSMPLNPFYTNKCCLMSISPRQALSRLTERFDVKPSSMIFTGGIDEFNPIHELANWAGTHHLSQATSRIFRPYFGKNSPGGHQHSRDVVSPNASIQNSPLSFVSNGPNYFRGSVHPS